MLKSKTDTEYAFIFLFGKEVNSFYRMMATTTKDGELTTDGETWGPIGFAP